MWSFTLLGSGWEGVHSSEADLVHSSHPDQKFPAILERVAGEHWCVRTCTGSVYPHRPFQM
jgi:hypothetical protein